MPIFNEADSTNYQLHIFKTEAEFEKVVKKLAPRIFGEDSVYFDIKRRVNGKEIISIPDAYVLEFADSNNPQLYIIENEIVGHDPFKHIGSQMLRFAVSFEDAQSEIWSILMADIQADKAKVASLERAVSDSKFRNVDDFLRHAVYAKFRGIVVIDEIRPELSRVLEKINAEIDVIQLQSYQSAAGTFCYVYNTLYEEEIGTEPDERAPMTAQDRKRDIERRAHCDTIVVPAQEDGFKRVFLGENRWFAIRIGAAMKDKIKYIAGYRVAPVSAVTHVAEVKEIRPYKDTNKYEVLFKGPAREVPPKKLKDPRYKPQGPVYVRLNDLEAANEFDEAMKMYPKQEG